MSKVPYVHSNFERIPDDFYPTIDKRCVYGFLEHFTPSGLCVDVCSPGGSGIVDDIIYCQIERVKRGDALGFACLLRSNFSFAKGRKPMFRDTPLYAGRIELLFRPWWREERVKQPIHNYVWQIWKAGSEKPVVLFSTGDKK